ncbi:hypothetical protein NXX40_19040 [Parabacteroides distasonis]|nr:hypothetical protein [Parabacteroides distasonis]
MRDITHFLLATLLSLATLACRHDTPPTDGPLSRQLPPGTEEIFRKLNDRDNREEALRLADSLAALPPSDDPWLEIRIAQAVANTLYKFRRDPSDAIRVQERALAVYRLHPDAADDPADLLSTLGHYYRRKGMREKEVEVIQEAMDRCVAHPEKLNRGFVYTFADLSSTYSDLGLYDKAMEAISRSIDYSLRLDSFTISDLYRMKAGIFWELEQHDSTLYYARQALKRGEEMKENAYVLAAKNILYNYYYEYVPDSIPAALEGYKELIEEEEAISAGYQDLFKFMLGACLVRDGKPEKGFPPDGRGLRSLQEIRGERYDGLDRTAFAQPLRRTEEGRQDGRDLPGIQGDTRLVATGGEAAVRHWCQRTLRDRTEGAGESGLIRRSGLEGTFARLYACHPDPSHLPADRDHCLRTPTSPASPT